MGDDHHRPLVGRQEILDPLERLEVQVVGRFVQQEKVRRLEQEAAQGDAHPPAARQRGQRGVECVRREAQTVQDRLGARLQAVPAQGLVPVLEIAVAVHELVGGSVLRLGHLAGQELQLAFQALDVRISGQHVSQGRAIPGGRDLLGQIADRGGLGPAHLARVHFHVAHEDPADGGLAGAVGPHQADPLTASDVPGEIPEDGLGPEEFAGLFDLNHGSRSRMDAPGRVTPPDAGAASPAARRQENSW